MKPLFKHWAYALVTASALSLPTASAVFADASHTAMGAQPLLLATNPTLEKTEEAVSDTWITSKVKSSFIADKNLSALDIEVETNKGVVALSGVVASEAERELAISTAKGIKGVTAVSADALKVAD